MSKVIRTVLTAAVVAAALGALVTPALADETQWQKDHPRRTEVNKRLANQNRRIHNEVKSGGQRALNQQENQVSRQIGK